MSARSFIGVLITAWLASTQGAGALPDYTTGEGFTLTIPYDPLSFSTASCGFPAATTRMLAGRTLASRMLAASGRTVWVQAQAGSSSWDKVATTDPAEQAMDPSFIVTTPNGEKIALGMGLEQPLYVFPTSLLSVDEPPDLTTVAGVRAYAHSYYDAAFRDGRYLFFNAGAGPQGDEAYTSAIYVVDTEIDGPSAISLAIANIPGASAGIVFDEAGDLITGNGYDDDEQETGELRIFTAADIAGSIESGVPLLYRESGLVVAKNVLSAASLGIDAEGNLFVGGGDVVGRETGQLGFAAVIDHGVLKRVLDGGSPVDPASDEDIMRLAPDPCMNDDTTSVTYVQGIDLVLVSANMATEPPECAPIDWSYGDRGPLVAYFPSNAPDEDGDEIPDGVDDETSQPVVGRAELERFMATYGSTEPDDNFQAAFDSDHDRSIGWSDYDAFLERWGKPRSR